MRNTLPNESRTTPPAPDPNRMHQGKPGMESFRAREAEWNIAAIRGTDRGRFGTALRMPPGGQSIQQ